MASKASSPGCVWCKIVDEAQLRGEGHKPLVPLRPSDVCTDPKSLTVFKEILSYLAHTKAITKLKKLLRAFQRLRSQVRGVTKEMFDSVEQVIIAALDQARAARAVVA